MRQDKSTLQPLSIIMTAVIVMAAAWAAAPEASAEGTTGVLVIEEELSPGEMPSELLQQYLQEGVWSPGEDFVIIASTECRNNDFLCLDRDDDPPSSDYPYDPVEPEDTRVLNPLVVLEPSYIDNHGGNDQDAVDHVWEARDHQLFMWWDYTGNGWLGGEGTEFHYPDEDIGTSNLCVLKQVAFENYLNDNNLRHRDFYILAAGDLEDCNGFGVTAGKGELADPPDSATMGKNKGNYQGLSSSRHFALVMAQEIGHNWGEPDHVCQDVDGEYSVMAGNGNDCPSGWTWDTLEFWLHYNHPDKPSGASPSTNWIIQGTAAYDD